MTMSENGNYPMSDSIYYRLTPSRSAAVKWIKAICLGFAIALITSCPAYCQSMPEDPHQIIAFELHKRIVVRKGASEVPLPNKPSGTSPSISPQGDTVAFLRGGDVYLLDLSTGRERRLTHIRVPHTFDVYDDSHISWHPSGNLIAFTVGLPYRYDSRHGVLRPTKKFTDLGPLSTIWTADVRTGDARRIIGPMPPPGTRWHEKTLDASDSSEPVFSPDGKFLWFISPGKLYEVKVGTHGIEPDPKLKLIAVLGKLDINAPGASKWGHGLRALAWDTTRNRLCYWIGRYWGTGDTEYAYIPWRQGRFGKPMKWDPHFSPKIEDWTTESCALDITGHLWVGAIVENQGRWVRQDAGYALPVDGDRPSFGRMRN
jgi:hypothetical protein